MNAAVLQTNSTDHSQIQIKPTAYDRFSALLLAICIIIGFLVSIMFLIWMTIAIPFDSASRTGPLLPDPGNDDRPEGIADDWQEPGVQEFPETNYPQLALTIEATTTAVSKRLAHLAELEGAAEKIGHGDHLGDKRKKGDEDGPPGVIPQPKRWSIQYTAGTMREYMSMLDALGVTLGAVSRSSNQIDYVADLLAESPTVATGQRKDETRLYFMTTNNRLRRWDTHKIAQSGIDPSDKLIVQFYDQATRDELSRLELRSCRRDGKEKKDIRQTVFGVRAKNSTFEFYVERIDYRPVP